MIAKLLLAAAALLERDEAMERLWRIVDLTRARCSYTVDAQIIRARTSLAVDGTPLSEILSGCRAGLSVENPLHIAWLDALVDNHPHSAPDSQRFICRVAIDGHRVFQEPLDLSDASLSRARIPPFFLTYSWGRKQLSILAPGNELILFDPSRLMTPIPLASESAASAIRWNSIASSVDLLHYRGANLSSGTLLDVLFENATGVPLAAQMTAEGGDGMAAFYEFNSISGTSPIQWIGRVSQVIWRGDSVTIFRFQVNDTRFGPSKLSGGLTIHPDAVLYDYSLSESWGRSLGRWREAEQFWPAEVRSAVRGL